MHYITKTLLLLLGAIALSSAAESASPATSTSDLSTTSTATIVATTTTINLIKTTQPPIATPHCTCGFFSHRLPILWGKRICINEATNSICPRSAGAALKAPNMLVLALVMLATTVLARGLCHGPRGHAAFQPHGPAPSSSLGTQDSSVEKEVVLTASATESTRTAAVSSRPVVEEENEADHDFDVGGGILGGMELGEKALREATLVVHKAADEASVLIDDAVKEAQEVVGTGEGSDLAASNGAAMQHLVDMAEQSALEGLDDLADLVAGKVMELLAESTTA